MSKEDLHKIITKGVASEISDALLQYYKEINFYKRKTQVETVEELFSIPDNP